MLLTLVGGFAGIWLAVSRGAMASGVRRRHAATGPWRVIHRAASPRSRHRRDGTAVCPRRFSRRWAGVRARAGVVAIARRGAWRVGARDEPVRAGVQLVPSLARARSACRRADWPGGRLAPGQWTIDPELPQALERRSRLRDDAGPHVSSRTVAQSVSSEVLRGADRARPGAPGRAGRRVRRSLAAHSQQSRTRAAQYPLPGASVHGRAAAASSARCGRKTRLPGHAPRES